MGLGISYSGTDVGEEYLSQGKPVGVSGLSQL